MPNTGRPSRGCQQCKERKVKCDNAFPVCQRCERNNRQCSGSQSETDITFRNTLAGASGTRRTRRLTPPKESAGRSPSIPQPMTRNDWLDQATAMYLYDYVVKVEDAKIGFGYLPGLPDLLSGESDASALRHAVSANALASLAQRSSMNHLMNEARRRYGLALHKIKGDLTDDAELGKDSTLATILCLDFFEVICAERPWTGCWSCHVDVLELVLRVRPIEQLETSDSKALNHNAHAYLQMRNLTLHLSPSDMADVRSTASDRMPEVQEHGILVASTCRILARVKDVIDRASPDNGSFEELVEIISDGIALEKRFEAWVTNAPAEFRHTTLPSPVITTSSTTRESSLETSSPDPPLYTYASPSIASLWNLHRCSRIKLNRRLANSLAKLTQISAGRPIPADYITFIAPAWMKIEVLTNEVFATVPYLLAEINGAGNLLQQREPKKAIGGLYLLFPLLTLFHSPETTPGQREWIKKRLFYVCNSLGIRKALDFRGL